MLIAIGRKIIEKNRWDRPLNTMHVMQSFSFSSLLYARWYWWSRIPKVNLTYLKSKGSYGKCTPLLRKIAVNPFVSHVFHEDSRATLDAIWFMAILCNRGVQFFFRIKEFSRCMLLQIEQITDSNCIVIISLSNNGLSPICFCVGI